jgi:hypothetical protein
MAHKKRAYSVPAVLDDVVIHCHCLTNNILAINEQLHHSPQFTMYTTNQL